MIFEDIPWSQPGVQTPPNILPLETQEVDVNNFNLVDDFGWMLFIWPYSNIDTRRPRRPVPDLDGYQVPGLRSVLRSKDAALMANYNCFSDQQLSNVVGVMPKLGINYDYVGNFDQGTAWNYWGYKKSPDRVIP